MSSDTGNRYEIVIHYTPPTLTDDLEFTSFDYENSLVDDGPGEDTASPDVLLVQLQVEVQPLEMVILHPLYSTVWSVEAGTTISSGSGLGETSLL